jgi:murein L,D-transpeptidase YcbB/YkuD
MINIKWIVTLLLFLVVGFSMKSQTSQQIIKQRVEEGSNLKTISVDGIILFSQIELPKIYNNSNFKVIWNKKKNRNDLIESLIKSEEEGLLPNDYHLVRISKILANTKYNKLKPLEAANLDMLLTDALMLYSSHLVAGKVEQSQISSKWDIDINQRPKGIDSLVAVTLKNNNIKWALQGLKPNHYFYLLMKQNLKKYRDIARNGGWPKIPSVDKLEKGDKDERIAIIRKYLEINNDLVSTKVDNDSLFDNVLELAVKKFQERHNLTVDGVIGKGTLEQMNVPVEDRIEQIRINLERARWVLHNPEDDFLMVNIAGFKVRRIKNKQEIFSSRVIVGKYHKSTPIFKDTMQYIILNPTWTLPYSIATSETLPKLKKDRGYLAAKHMIIMDRSGKVLNPKKINFHKYSAGNFPFIVRQEAGPWNSLGQVKFIFPNKNSIYLHDTPARNLFNMQDRAFSHGCIRTEDKWGLLMSLMDDPKVWNMDKINEILASGETTRIDLPKPLPIYLLYWTTGVDRQGNIYFIKDVYKRDPAVLKALNLPVKFKSIK